MHFIKSSTIRVALFAGAAGALALLFLSRQLTVLPVMAVLGLAMLAPSALASTRRHRDEAYIPIADRLGGV